ncbi:TPA: hypothetical protein ACH3X1_008530 [Trebouxia sp. C0004]
MKSRTEPVFWQTTTGMPVPDCELIQPLSRQMGLKNRILPLQLFTYAKPASSLEAEHVSHLHAHTLQVPHTFVYLLPDLMNLLMPHWACKPWCAGCTAASAASEK